jgi:tetratricopeptide (TPR) repeat protein
MEVASSCCEKSSVRSERGKPTHSAFHVARLAVAAVLTFAVVQCAPTRAQVAPLREQSPGAQNQSGQAQANDSDRPPKQDADAELQTGTALTRKGSFREALPHLLAAQAGSSNPYAANFNLALCYVGTNQFKKAIQILRDLQISGHVSVDVENLLAQAYIGNSQPQEALTSLQKAALLSPRNEKLFSFIADACTDSKDYRLGLKVVEIGLRDLPQSARLHYERAMFLTQLDQFDQAKPEFELAAKLGPGSEIGYLALAHEDLYEGNIPDAIRTAREGVGKGYESHALLTMLGESLIRSGIGPGQPEFAEAQTDLEKAVAGQPNDPTSQIALGSLYLVAGRLEDAITHLEKARQLEPDQPAVYANLAKAYQRRGDTKQAEGALAALEKLNQEQANRIGAAPGDRKAGYAGRALPEETSATSHP